MAILIDSKAKVLIQGITGKQGVYHTVRSIEDGVCVIAGVTPGRGGKIVEGIPVYDTVEKTLEHTAIDASMILVPPPAVLEAATEAIDHRIPLVVIITEFVPFHDTLKIRILALEKGVRIVGPNTIGVISPGRSKVGIMAAPLYKEGHVGIISRSGTLTHEVASNLSFRGIGQSTCVCIGGDAAKGLDFVDLLKLFREDKQTRQVVMIGEIGGADEESASRYLAQSKYPKPVTAFIAGANAPEEKRMGHAGAIIADGFGTAESKISALSASGVFVAEKLEEIYTRVESI